MTEVCEDDWLVRVRAQVMFRDEGTGGWVALGGGGLANVMVGRRRLPRDTDEGSPASDETSRVSAPHYEYYIYGKRISDQNVVLSCTIKKDFQFNKVMPTFHHWVTGEKRFGLTFQTAADARAFDKGVRAAVEELLDGLGGPWPILHTYKRPGVQEEEEENNIFECLNLPSESRSSSENSTVSPRRQAIQTPILSAITLPHRKQDDKNTLELVSKDKLGETCSVEGALDADKYSYVQLTAHHEYSYPSLGVCTMPVSKPPNTEPENVSLKRAPVGNSPPEKKPSDLPQFHTRLKCRHCQEWYLENSNGAGACEFAPDWFGSCIDTVTCVKCAQGMVYHCMSDGEGDNGADPCSCSPVSSACITRWAGLSLLSTVVPCLCMYPLLKVLHRCCSAIKLVGGHHAPNGSQQ